ncbi:MAG TPA: hypothetical protein VFV99_03020 [Kofleriaceae bacterium]|nr:hypothetical protein [Kofleriaceae bacterium]
MRAGCILLLVVAAGCLDPRTQHCADGSVCGPGLFCATAGGATVCVTDEQFTACNGLASGARCVTTDIFAGTCIGGACISSGCGNGITDDGEACDDGNLVSGDGCSADCRSAEVCGNSITDTDEECDCGFDPDDPTEHNPACPGPNSDTSGPCSMDCHLRCGDGVVSADEGCDPGITATVSCAGTVFDRGLTTCSASCQPVIKPETCRYIGFRTRVKQPVMSSTSTPLVTKLAGVTESNGFYIAENRANTYTNYMMVGNPYISSTPFGGIWAANMTTAIAVGGMGKAVHYSGTSWVVRTTGTTVDLRDVWGRSASDVYAVGDSTVLHYNGTIWSALSPPAGNYRAVSGDATHVYVVGDQGKVAIYDGTQWTTEDPGTTVDLVSVWAAGGMVVAVGDAATIRMRASNGTWSQGRTATTVNLRSVWGSTTDGFFAVGERGTVLFYDGAVWRPLALGRGVTGSPAQTLFSVTGIEGVVVGIVGSDDVMGYEGAAWSPTIQPTSETLYSIWGTAPDNIYAVGRNGTILHHDGLSWTQQPSPTSFDLHAIQGTAANDIYAAGDSLALLHYNGSQWTSVGGGGGNFTSLLATGTNRVLGASTSGIYEYDGTTFSRVTITTGRAIWGASATDVWVAGAAFAHFDGTSWTTTTTMTDATTLIGTSANDIYAVGKSPLHYDGATWSAGPFKDDRLIAACLTPSNRLFGVGQQGALRYWNGTAIEPMISRTTADLSAVFMTGHVLVMAGADGTLDTMVFHR